MESVTEMMESLIKPLTAEDIQAKLTRLFETTVAENTNLIENLSQSLENVVEKTTTAINDLLPGEVDGVTEPIAHLLSTVIEALASALKTINNQTANALQNTIVSSLRSTETTANSTLEKALKKLAQTQLKNMEAQGSELQKLIDETIRDLSNCIPPSLTDHSSINQLLGNANKYVDFIAAIPDSIKSSLNSGVASASVGLSGIALQISLKTMALSMEMTRDIMGVGIAYANLGSKVVDCLGKGFARFSEKLKKIKEIGEKHA